MFTLTDNDRKYIVLSALKIKEYCKEKSVCTGCPFDNGNTCALDEIRPEKWKVEKKIQ